MVTELWNKWELAVTSYPKQKKGQGSSSCIGQLGTRNCELICWSSLEEKDWDAIDQKEQKKPEYETTYPSSPLLKEGGKDKVGGGEGEKEELSRIQKEEEEVVEEEGGIALERIEAKMGNICSALKPPKKVRK